MLYNLAIMLQQLGRYEDCRGVIRHAVSLRHEEKIYEVFRLWAAFEEALAGNAAIAEQHLATLTPENIKQNFRPVEVMTRLLIRLQSTPAGERKAFFKSVREKLRTAFGKTPPGKSTRYVRDAYRRFIALSAGQGGGTELRVWGWWYYGQSNLLTGLIVAGAVLSAFVYPPVIAPFVVLACIRAMRRK